MWLRAAYYNLAGRRLETHDVHPPVASSRTTVIFLAPCSLALNVCFPLEVSATFRNKIIFRGESPLAYSPLSSWKTIHCRMSFTPYSV